VYRILVGELKIEGLWEMMIAAVERCLVLAADSAIGRCMHSGSWPARRARCYPRPPTGNKSLNDL
jgi:hypothetical protein